MCKQYSLWLYCRTFLASIIYGPKPLQQRAKWSTSKDAVETYPNKSNGQTVDQRDEDEDFGEYQGDGEHAWSGKDAEYNQCEQHTEKLELEEIAEFQGSREFGGNDSDREAGAGKEAI